MSIWQLLKNGVSTGDNVKQYVVSNATKYDGYNWMNTSQI